MELVALNGEGVACWQTPSVTPTPSPTAPATLFGDPRLDFIIASIAVPLIVALATTLLLELFAKPRLEARKARLIRDRQQIDEVVFAFQRLSMDLGAIVDEAPPGTQQADVRMVQAGRARDSATNLMEVISRLSPRYADKHASHIGKTSKHVGYIYAVTDRIARGGPAGQETFNRMSNCLAQLDVYFRANIDFKDSQEPWTKRWYYRRTHRNPK